MIFVTNDGRWRSLRCLSFRHHAAHHDIRLLRRWWMPLSDFAFRVPLDGRALLALGFLGALALLDRWGGSEPCERSRLSSNPSNPAGAMGLTLISR